MNNKGLLFIFICLFLPNTVFATSISINEAVQKALENNPELRSLKKELYSAQKIVQVNKSQRFGSIYLKGGFNKTKENFIVYPMYKEAFQAGGKLPFDDEYFYYKLNYTLPLYTGGQITESINLSQSIRAQKSFRLQSFINNLVYKVKESYLRVLLLDKKIESLEAGITALKSLLVHIKHGVSTGKFAKLDMLKTVARLEELKKLKTITFSDRQSAYMALLNLMGEKAIYEYSLSSNSLNSVEKIEIPPAEKILNIALQNRSDLKLFKKQLQAKESALRIKKAKRLPQLSLNIGYNWIDANGIDFERGYYTASLNLTIPIFTFGRLKNEYRSAEADRDALFNLYESKKFEIRKEVMDAWYSFKKAKAVLVSSQAELRLAREVEEIERLKYINGRGRIDDLLFAIAKTVEAEAGLFSAKMQIYLAYENIMKTTEGALK